MVSSSQSRIAKIEAGDPTVTIDLLIKSLLALGVSPREIGRTSVRGIKLLIGDIDVEVNQPFDRSALTQITRHRRMKAVVRVT